VIARNRTDAAVRSALAVVPNGTALAPLAARIHAEYEGARQDLIKRVVEIGRLLCEAREQCRHGEWIPWVEENLPFGRMQPNKYIRIFEDSEKPNVNPSLQIAHATNAACRALVGPTELD
jgi:hypothetical protein